jgi:hypothetical protein
VNNIKIDVKEIGLGGMDCFDLAQDSDKCRTAAITVIKLRVP